MNARRLIGFAGLLVALSLTAAMFLFLLSGCGNSSPAASATVTTTATTVTTRNIPANIVGDYVSSKVSTNTMSLKDNGTFHLIQRGIAIDGSFDVEGKEISLTFSNGAASTTSQPISQTGSIKAAGILDPQGFLWIKQPAAEPQGLTAASVAGTYVSAVNTNHKLTLNADGTFALAGGSNINGDFSLSGNTLKATPRIHGTPLTSTTFTMEMDGAIDANGAFWNKQ